VAPGKKQAFWLLIPYAQGAVLSALHDEHPILQERFEAEGTKVQVLLDNVGYQRFKAYRTEE